jgi:hypothetical protein
MASNPAAHAWPTPVPEAALPPGPLLACPPEELDLEENLVTEDGVPVDGAYSEKLMRLLPSVLYSSWVRPEGRPFVAMANVGLFFHVEEPPLVPDVLVSDGVKMPDNLGLKKHQSYFMWRYGKPPDLVTEIVSNREGGELDRKLALYARIGVTYYVVWDPFQIVGKKKLSCFILQGGKYDPLSAPLFPLLNLGLIVWHGRWEETEADWLRWTDLEGNLLPLPQELVEQERQRAEQERQRAEQERQRAEQERQRAEQERQRAEQEHHRAEQEHQKAERLAAQLRALGVNPEP